MLPKTNTYVESYDGQTKWMYFLIEDNGLLENVILFGIISAMIQNKSSILSLSTVNNFWKLK